MIDTITLAVNEANYRVVSYKYLQLEQTNKGKNWENTSGIFIYAKEMKKKGVYAPKFKIGEHSKRKDNNILRITVSLPKLVKGSNLYELSLEDLDIVCLKIEEHMKRAGIATKNLDLKKCIVERIDYSKNIYLPAWAGPAYQFIYLLRDFNYKRSSDFSLNLERDGKDGNYLAFHNDSQGYTVYDKISEIVKKGFTETEQKIKKDVISGNQKHNILRFEVSLRKKQTLWEFIGKRVDKKDGPTLENLFCPEISKTILLDIFDQVFTPGVATLLSYSRLRKNDVEDMLKESGMKINEVALWLHILNKFRKIGVNRTYEEIKIDYDNKPLEYIKQKIKKLPNLVENKEPNNTNIIKFLREELNKFEPIKAPSRKLKYYINNTLNISG